MTYFLHYAPQGRYPSGVFIPYNSRVEAERQAAADLHYGLPRERILGIFTAPYELPVGGWSPEQMDTAWAIENGGADYATLLPHHDPEQRVHVATGAEIAAVAKAHQADMEREEHEAYQRHMAAIHDAVRAHRSEADPQMAVPGNAYSVMTGGTATAGAMALAAATAKTAIMFISASANQFAITQISISFDGVTASAVPVLCELVMSTQGAAGTTTAQTPIQKRGWPPQASQTTAGQTYTAEPTTLTVADKWLLSPNGGIIVIQFPLGREPTGIVTAATAGKGIGVRLTAPAIVNVHVGGEFEE